MDCRMHSRQICRVVELVSLCDDVQDANNLYKEIVLIIYAYYQNIFESIFKFEWHTIIKVWIRYKVFQSLETSSFESYFAKKNMEAML